jgi:hypothetical protein
MKYHYWSITAIMSLVLLIPFQSGACEGHASSDNTMAEVYMGDYPVKMKGYVQQVFRDVLFALTKTLDDVPQDLQTVEITIKPHDVEVLVNGQQLQIKAFIEELYREIGLGILTAMGESPDRNGQFRIILYTT